MGPLLVLAVAALLAWLLLRRANELCAVRVLDGKARLVRGRAPGALVPEFEDVLRRAQVSSVELRIVSEGGAPRLVPNPGLTEEVAQRLRNVLGPYSVLHFRRGPRARP
jgi:hypothetical protein